MEEKKNTQTTEKIKQNILSSWKRLHFSEEISKLTIIFVFGYPRLPRNINSLPTERERRIGKYLPEVVAGTDRAQGDPYKNDKYYSARTERAKSITS